ncbi:alpha/beta hydrolase [Sporosarcina sp. P37]|uniref:alpha/beta fold hydrolase n=1 Tax=unclassified Sporosarcina TaxID=2647733 RepID=UPI0009BD824C|nr:MULTISPECIES: alpha/beta hydrolase [unclassified Sporosarcina]ARD48227.1 sigma factor sigB regulation protein rsbQ [Sporosarcina sp. P33]ARK24744.1 alpha/beta hydrolase [Sporosarcina sp. P37]PID19901.1 alpha/beta hydrolase [Sporosarcina sp. P35]
MTLDIIKRNAVRITGTGQETIVFAHGFGCDQTVWNRLIPAFEKQYRVITFDYVGSGQSDKSAYTAERYETLSGYAQDVIEICDALNLKDILYVGHSVSGMIGVLASIERPDLMSKLIMIGPSPHYLNEPDYYGGFEREDIDELLDMMEMNYKEFTKYLAPIAMKNEDRPHLSAEFESMLYTNNPGIARRFAEATFMSDVREELSKVTVRTLILQPTEDSIVPLEVGEYIQQRIPNSELVVMQAKGHNPHISHPEETIRDIKRFIEDGSA